jgi:spore coat protein H
MRLGGTVVALCVLVACGGGGPNPGDPDAAAGDDVPPGDGAPSTAGDRVFDPGVLHEVAITVAEGDLDTLENDTETRVPCTITYDGETVAQAGIKKKGQTSQRPLSGKPGFSVKLNEFVSGQKLDGLKKLLLDNAVQDPTFLTGHIGYELSRRAGVPAPRTAHAVLTFNGEMKGIYVVEEAVNQQWLEATYGEAYGAGNLYEGPWDFPQGAGAMELKDEVEEGRSREDLEALTAIVMDEPDETFAAALATRLDVDEFITNYAVEVIGGHWDNYAYAAWNYYFYDHPGDQKFRILPHGVNWPYWHADLDPFDLYVYPWGKSTPPGRLCERLRAIPALDDAFRAEVRRVADVAWDTAVLDARIERVKATLHSRAITDDTFIDELAEFDARVGEATAFVAERKAYLVETLGL